MKQLLSKGSITHSKLKTNIFWNFGSLAFPLFLAIFTIPSIINGLGEEKFGILTLIWAIIGYSSILDFGLGRALTQLISKKIGENKTDDFPELIWTSLITVTILGFIATIIICIFTPIIVDFINVSDAYKKETTQSLYLLAFTMPLMIGIMNMQGILEAFHKFKPVSLLRIPVVLFNFIGPLAVLLFTSNLTMIVLVLVIGRLINYVLYFIVCSHFIENFFSKISFKTSYLKSLFNVGGWMTLSNLINPFMSYMDRFFVSSLLGTGMIAYYTTPVDVLRRISIVPSSILGVMFPAMGSEFVRDKEKTRALYLKSLLLVFSIMLVICISGLFLLKPSISIWLGSEFAEKSYVIAQIFLIAMCFDALNFTPFSLIQATGKANITAIIHLVEFPIYLSCLYLSIQQFGLIGAPITFLAKTIVDCFLLNIISLKILKKD